MSEQLATALRRYSSRLTPPPTPAVSVLIHLAVLVCWVALFLNAFGRGGLFAWSVGLAYLAYDTVLVGFTAWQIRDLISTGDSHRAEAAVRLSLSVLIAVHNEAAVLPATVGALLSQDDPPDEIVVADDGSTDATAEVLRAEFGLVEPDVGAKSTVTHGTTSIVWLRLSHGGKARALNAAITATDTDIMVTVDGDTLLERPAIGVVRQAFSRDPNLAGVTGIITPVCRPTFVGRIWQFFQTYEYVRNFLGRYAFMRIDCLQLISGAFAGFRREHVVELGGFDEVCMVEDYELVHRLRRYAGEHGLPWKFEVLGGAQARTEAPGSVAAFLRQRRRWFGGFLQTQWWYRAMTGDRRMGRLGTVMLPIKAVDTLTPIFGLVAFGLLIGYAVTRQTDILGPVLLVVAGKLAIDVVFGVWAMRRYRWWVGDPGRGSLVGITLMTIVEPVTFRLMLHGGALLGWFAFLSGGQRWGRQHRFGLRGTHNAPDQ
ncbi:glycosyltransferase family 2 protein [Mycobacterium barrassiae]|uniref:glycosyltransferase family 2 protein n=1 Tax=Mycobacterium barrassiae TaxID=319709 RepID=UPI002265B2F8|nr:glycosyltransferase [Mycobacterium barrassiae]